MFIKTSYLNEDFTSDLKSKLQEKEDAPINLKRQASKNAIDYLVKSAELFTDLGFDKQALNVINILDKFCEDNVSSEKMIDNIKEDGTALDVNKADDDIEVEIEETSYPTENEINESIDVISQELKKILQKSKK